MRRYRVLTTMRGSRRNAIQALLQREPEQDRPKCDVRHNRDLRKQRGVRLRTFHGQEIRVSVAKVTIHCLMSIHPHTLSRTRLFTRVHSSQLAEISSLARECTFPQGTVLFSAGDLFDQLYIVLSGGVEVSSFNSDGRSVLLGLFGPGEPLGIAALLGSRRHFVDCICVSETRFMYFDRPTILRLLDKYPQIACTVIQLLSERLFNTTEQLKDTALECVSERLVHLFCRLARDSGFDIEDGTTRIDLRLSQDALGRMIGCSRESVNRAIGFLIEQGVVHREGARYFLDYVNLAAD